LVGKHGLHQRKDSGTEGRTETRDPIESEDVEHNVSSEPQAEISLNERRQYSFNSGLPEGTIIHQRVSLFFSSSLRGPY
jgi:hypothetical protein